jgi:hypothetical protein
MNGMMIMVLGFIAGAVIASGIWGVVWALFKNERRTGENRSEIVEEIASQCADIENKIVAYSAKSISETAFRSAVSPVLEKITLSLSTNMDSFDVYYVKYIESLIARYRQAIIAPVKSYQSVMNAEAVLVTTEKKEEFSSPANVEKPAPEPTPAAQSRPETIDQSWEADNSKESPQKITEDKEIDFTIEKDEQESPGALSVEDLPPEPPETSALVDISDSSDEETDHAIAPEPIFETVSSDSKMKDTKIIRTENIPEEKQSEIEKIIIAELNKEPEAKKLQEKPKEPEASKQPLESKSEYFDLRPSGSGKQAEKIFEKKEKEPLSPPPPPPQKDENFISGEDLVAKLDSFFGI